MRTLQLVLFICLAFSVQSQTDSSKRNFQFGLSTGLLLNDYGAAKTISVFYQKNKHQFDLGPSFGLFSHYGDSKSLCLEGNYRYYPNGINQRFNLFFLLNLSYYHSNRTYNGTQGTIVYLNQFTDNIYNFNAGYGFNLAIWKGLFLGVQVGAGISHTTYDESHTSNPTQPKDFSYSSVNNRYCFLGQLNLGYRF